MPKRTSARRLLAPAALLAALATLAGCQTYTQQTADRDQAMRSGDIATAVTHADKDAEKNKDNKDTILYRLEQGAVLRAAALANLPPLPSPVPARVDAQTGESLSPVAAYLHRSVAAFDDAARRIADHEAAAKVRVGSEAGAMLTNQANVPYKGRAYDKVMLHTYQALNYLQLADPDAARVELNRALQSQRDAVQANAKRIAEAQALADEAKSGDVQDEQGRQGQSYDVDRATSDPRTSAGISGIESKFNAAILPYGDYVNPFTTFLDALVFTHQGLDASDLERARKSWERVVNFAPGNPYARADYVAVEPDIRAPALAADTGIAAPAVPASEQNAEPVAAAVPADTRVAPAADAPLPAPSDPAGLTYVIFETGSAPYRDQIRIDIPIFVVTNSISYVGAAFPQLETVGGQAAHLRVSTTAGDSHDTALVGSMDSVVAQDFKNEWPTILTKTLVSTATKATIDAVLQKQMQDQAGATGALLFKIATAVTQMAINIADTRTWRSLPKEFQYARLPTPADRRLVLSAAGLATTVQVEPGAVNVVYVKSTSTFSPLFVGQFVLKK